MTWLGIPVFEWLALAIALGLGVEAWWSLRASRRATEEGRLEQERPPRDEGPGGPGVAPP